MEQHTNNNREHGNVNFLDLVNQNEKKLKKLSMNPHVED